MLKRLQEFAKSAPHMQARFQAIETTMKNARNQLDPKFHFAGYFPSFINILDVAEALNKMAQESFALSQKLLDKKEMSQELRNFQYYIDEGIHAEINKLFNDINFNKLVD